MGSSSNKKARSKGSGKKRKKREDNTGEDAKEEKKTKKKEPKPLSLTVEQVVWGPVSSIMDEKRVHVVSMIVRRLLNSNQDFKNYFKSQAHTFNKTIADMSEKPSNAQWNNEKKKLIESLSKKQEVIDLVHTVSLKTTVVDEIPKTEVNLDNGKAADLKPPTD